jgi:GNAT superfamily N-acetyltransferase
VSAAGVNPVEAAREADSVAPAPEAHRDGVVAALARAFYDDPVFGWMAPDDSRRLAQIERLFGLFGRRVWFSFDLTFTTARVAGGSIWVPPGQSHLSLLRQVLMFPAVARGIGLRDLPRFLRAMSLMDAKHPHEPHYYLPVVGVDPPWQGKGLGGALLRPMLERCDREGMPAYLEASTPRNRALYERNGFEVTEQVDLPDGPPLWLMWRRPHSAAG